MTRRAPVSTDRADRAVARLEAVSMGDHVADPGSPGETYIVHLAARKLGELLDETGGLTRPISTQLPDLDDPGWDRLAAAVLEDPSG